MEQFKEYIKGCNEIAKKWVIAFIICNVLWAAVFATFLILAYVQPKDYYQIQDFDSHTQEQSYSESGN